MTNEERIDISEYEYDADKGIWSNYYKKFLKGYVYKDGYVRVGLKCNDGKYRLFQYHRAMWYLAYGEIPEGYQVNHIDENKLNNVLSNLNLMTCKENINWGTGIERRAAKRRGVPRPDVVEKNKGNTYGKLNKNNPKLSKQVVAVDKDGNIVYEFPSIQEAGRNGFDNGAVGKCCNNCYCKLGNYFKGYYWYFKEDWEKLVWERKLEVKKV